MPTRNHSRIIRKFCYAFSVGSRKNYWGVECLVNPKYYTTSCSIKEKKELKTSSDFGERKVCVSGLNLNIRETGEGSHNVLCLPGLIGTIESDFGPIFRSIDTSKFRLICWDPPGYGKSRPPNRISSPDFYLDDAKLVAQLMDVLGYRKYSILGWSSGGMTGYTLASLFPKQVTHLILWGAHGYLDEHFFVDLYRYVDTNYWPPKLLAAAQSVYGKEYLETILTNWGKSIQKFFISGGQVVLEERIKSVKCPTLVLHGSKDPILSLAQFNFLKEHFSCCQARIFADGKHNLQYTHTTDFLKEVEKFLLSPTKDIRA